MPQRLLLTYYKDCVILKSLQFSWKEVIEMSKQLTIYVPEGADAIWFMTPGPAPKYLRLLMGSTRTLTESRDGVDATFTVESIEKSEIKGINAVTLSYEGNVSACMRTQVRVDPAK
jgi:hypothetical protein